MSARGLLLACAAALGVAAGCGASDGSLGAPCQVGNDCAGGLLCDVHGDLGSCQYAHDDHVEPTPTDCSADARGEVYTAGLVHAGAWASVALVDAAPAPPERGDNTWTIEIRDADGSIADDIALEVEPYMPDHAHGTTVRCDVSDGDAPGQYVLTPVNLFMPGLWQVILTVHDDAEAPRDDDEIVFQFCVDP